MTLTTHNGPLGPNGSIFPDIWKSVAVQVEKIRAEQEAADALKAAVSAPLSIGMAAE